MQQQNPGTLTLVALLIMVIALVFAVLWMIETWSLLAIASVLLDVLMIVLILRPYVFRNRES